jgi:hypothetical protein
VIALTSAGIANHTFFPQSVVRGGPLVHSAETEGAPHRPLTLERMGGIVIAAGDLSYQQDEQILRGMIAALFPGAKVNSQIRISNTTAGSEYSLSGISFALRHLALLKSGRAQIERGTINLSGEAASTGAFEKLHWDFHEELPIDVRAGHLSVSPPTGTAIWLAQAGSSRIHLSGVVPGFDAKRAILEFAAEQFSGKELDVTMDLAASGPENWLLAAQLSISCLGHLQAGTASIYGKTIKIEGTATGAAALQKIVELTAARPEGFVIETRILFSAPVARNAAH